VRRNLCIRAAASNDVPALYRLELANFATDRMSLRQLKRHINSKTALVLVAHLDGVVLGSAVVFFRGDLARLYSLAVDEGARGKGVGQELLTACLAQAKARAKHMRLEVRADNHGALALYHKLGFDPVRALPAYYQDGANGLRMAKALP
jgi:[ribosomal protein S18]-alanine N-acetyltransferase